MDRSVDLPGAIALSVGMAQDPYIMRAYPGSRGDGSPELVLLPNLRQHLVLGAERDLSAVGDDN
jgi:hypothetical protein